MAQPQISLNSQSCVDRLRVLTSHRAFEPSQLDDEQPSGRAETTICPPPPPPPPPPRPPDVTHVMNDTRPSTLFTALLHPCIIVNGNRRTEKNGVGLGTRLARTYNQQLKNKWFTLIDPELYTPADGNVECSYPISCMDGPVIGVSCSFDWGCTFWAGPIRLLSWSSLWDGGCIAIDPQNGPLGVSLAGHCLPS